MNNFIFKSPRRLVKKLSNTPEVDLILRRLDIILEQNRNLRQDLVDMRLMINRLLIDKHLQMQVDTYFEDDKPEETPEHNDEEPD